MVSVTGLEDSSGFAGSVINSTSCIGMFCLLGLRVDSWW